MSEYFPSIDNNFRSKCCHKPIRLGWKTIKKTNIRVKIWICTNCKTRDIDVVTKESLLEVFNERDNSALDESAL